MKFWAAGCAMSLRVFRQADTQYGTRAARNDARPIPTGFRRILNFDRAQGAIFQLTSVM